MEINNLPDKVKIYTLSDPITFEVRYVGITTNTLEYRYKRHFYDKKNYKKNKWFKQLKSKSMMPIIEEIDVVDFDGWQFWEKWYISLFKTFGFDLVNLTEGGEGMFGYKHTEATKLKIKEKRKMQIFTEDTRKKLSKVRIGNSYALGKKHSKFKNNLKSQTQRGKYSSSIIRTSENGDVKKFKSISDAGDSVSVTQNNIWYACTKRKGKLFRGYYWKYENEKEKQFKNNIKIPYDDLYEKYIKEELPVKKIGEFYNCSLNKIYRLIKKYKLSYDNTI